MAQSVKAFGLLKFDDKEDYESETEILEGDVLDLVESCASWKKRTLDLRVDGEVGTDDAFLFQDWLQSIVEVAVHGHLDTWSEDDGENGFLRMHAGGKTEKVAGPFPV